MKGVRHAFVACAVALGVVGSACGQAHEDVRILRAALNRTEAAPHVLRYTDQADGRTVTVTLHIADAFRSRSTLELDGVPLLQEIVSDDAAAVRLLRPDRWNPAANSPLGSILGEGKWVVDPAGAPPVFFAQQEQRGITDVGNDQIFDAANSFEYVRLVANQARDVVRFNKTSLDYRPALDPFRNLVDADEKAGLIRYDAVPPALPRSAEQNRGQTNVDARPFRRLAIYLKDGMVKRILERIDFERHEEIVKAKQKGRPRFLLEVLEQLRKGVGENPVRQRSMSIEVLSVGERVRVRLPSDALRANIGELLQSQELATLPSRSQLRGKPAPAASPPSATPRIPGS